MLHVIILMSALSGTIIKLITLSSFEIVFLRTLIAFLILGFIIKRKKLSFICSWKETLYMIGTGLLLAAFWILNTITIKISTVSVAIVAMATTSIWITFIHPLISGEKSKPFQLLIGINAIIGIYIIYGSDFEYGEGFAVGITGAIFAALVTIFNAGFAKKHHYQVVTFYQFVGAWIGTILFFPVYNIYFDIEELLLELSWEDAALILLLSTVISVFAYSVLIKIQKKIPPFMIALTNNLAPIYGILIAILLLGTTEYMNFGFYIGAMLLFISVLVYPILTNYMTRFQKEKELEADKIKEEQNL